MLYRAYILIRLKTIGKEQEVVNKLKNLSSQKPNENWEVTYASTVYGGWDMIAECSFDELEDLNSVVTLCRTDKELSEYIEETTTLVGTRKNYPFN